MRKSTALTCLVLVLLGARALVAEAPRVKVLDVPLYGQKWDVWCWAASAQMVIDYLYQEEFQDFLVNTVRAKKGPACDAPLLNVKTTDLPRTVRQCEIVNQRYSRKISKNIKRAKQEFCGKKPDRDQDRCLKNTLIFQPRSVNCCADDILDLKREDRDICVKTGFPNRSVFGSFGVEATFNPTALSFDQLMEELDHDRPVIFSWLFDGGGGHMLVAVGYVFVPPDEEWVIVNNPWPPPGGKRYMIPYSYYLSGPYRHWYDWSDTQLTDAAKENWRRGSWYHVETKEDR